jgi:hypothetical protein
MDVVLLRVLYARAMVGNPPLALGPFAPFGWLVGDPRVGIPHPANPDAPCGPAAAVEANGVPGHEEVQRGCSRRITTWASVSG